MYLYHVKDQGTHKSAREGKVEKTNYLISLLQKVLAVYSLKQKPQIAAQSGWRAATRFKGPLYF